MTDPKLPSEPLTVNVDHHHQVLSPLCLKGRFKDTQIIGYGATGLVFSATDSQLGNKVAIKKLAFSSQRSCQLGLREIRLLRQMQHDNIVTVHEIIDPGGTAIHTGDELTSQMNSAYIIQELLDTDLNRLIQSKQLTADHSKLILYQLLRGLKYIHSANVIHRDLKPGNIMVNCENLLVKIGDFGLARVVDPSYNHQGHLTENVGSCWYKAPEVILQPRHYTQSIDMWAVGCILAEMLIGQPVFAGTNELDQLLKVIDTLHLSDADWSLVLRIMPNKLLKNHPLRPRAPLTARLSCIETEALNLLEHLLAFDPNQRPSAETALSDPYLAEYHWPEDEPVALVPFGIEHEVDELSPAVLRQMILHESSKPPDSCGSYCPSFDQQNQTSPRSDGSGNAAPVSTSGQMSPPPEGEMHTLEEILQLNGGNQEEEEEECQDLVTASQQEVQGGGFTHEIEVDIDPIALKNLRNSSSSRQNSPNIFEVNDSGSRPASGKKKVKSHENSEDDEKDVVEMSKEKMEEDIEVGNADSNAREEPELANQILHSLPLSVDVNTSLMDETENVKEFSQPSPKQHSELVSESLDNSQAVVVESPLDKVHNTSNPTNVDCNQGQPPSSGWSQRNSGKETDSNRKEGEIFVKHKQKSDRKTAASRKLIMDKIESEKNWRSRRRNRHSELTDEELDELYRLPTDHLRNDNDYSNQRLREKLKANIRQCGKVNEGINEKIQEECKYTHYEGACGGDECPEEVFPTAMHYQLSPTFSDEDSQIVQLEISSTSAVILRRNEVINHSLSPRGHVLTHQEASLAHRQQRSSQAPNVIPVQSTGGSTHQRDPSSSPEAPSSPRPRQTGARPKKSPKKQRAL